ncbi:MAG: hypothetical protein WC917_03760 [Bacilli bacterium]|jgi:hypothetical protein
MIRTSTIHKGHHRGNVWFAIPKNKISGTIILNDTMFADGNFISKITGISGYNCKGQKCSARIGWKSVNGMIEIWAYVWNNGISPQQNLGQKFKLASYKPDAEVPFEIEYKGENVTFKTNNNVDIIKATAPTIKYLAMPYYGGEEVAPHKINVNVKFN